MRIKNKSDHQIKFPPNTSISTVTALLFLTHNNGHKTSLIDVLSTYQAEGDLPIIPSIPVFLGGGRSKNI